MKTQLKLTALALLLSVLNSQLSRCHAQGTLTPPGAPAPTMKSLAQIEPRTAITNTASAVTIAQPGSYYLTGNLTVSSGDAITIATNGVTLDLNGFTVSSTAASAAGTAIFLNNSIRDITILNGHIRGGVTNNGSGVFSGNGFNNGISGSFINASTEPVNVLVSKVSVSGCLNRGIFLGNSDSIIVESCTARSMGGNGITASTIKACVAADCGGYAIIGDQISDSRGECVGSSSGSSGISAGVVLNSYGSCSNGIGINAKTAQNCYGFSAGSGTGIQTTTAQNCYGESKANGTGIYATTAQNCYGRSTGYGSALHAENAENCWAYNDGSDGFGIQANQAQNCYALCAGGTGIAANTAISCYGQSNDTYPGLAIVNNAYNCSAVSFSGNGILLGYNGTAPGELIGCTAWGSSNGIAAGNGCTIKDCTTYGNNSNGIVVGPGCTIKDCSVNFNSRRGISAGGGCNVTGCTAYGNSTVGIFADTGSTISGCTSRTNGTDGILFTDWCLVSGNVCAQNGGSGIHALGGTSRIQGNNVIVNAQSGLKVDTLANLITQNSSRGNGTNYNIVANNNVGVIVVAPASAAIVGNTGGAGLGTTDPSANFSY